MNIYWASVTVLRNKSEAGFFFQHKIEQSPPSPELLGLSRCICDKGQQRLDQIGPTFAITHHLPIRMYGLFDSLEVRFYTIDVCLLINQLPYLTNLVIAIPPSAPQLQEFVHSWTFFFPRNYPHMLQSVSHWIRPLFLVPLTLFIFREMGNSLFSFLKNLGLVLFQEIRVFWNNPSSQENRTQTDL